MYYLRSGSDSLAFRAILKVHKRARFWDILKFVFSVVKPLINREIFLTINKLFFHRISFSCEKTTMKIPGPVNDLFSQVVINLKSMSAHIGHCGPELRWGLKGILKFNPIQAGVFWNHIGLGGTLCLPLFFLYLWSNYNQTWNDGTLGQNLSNAIKILLTSSLGGKYDVIKPFLVSFQVKIRVPISFVQWSWNLAQGSILKCWFRIRVKKIDINTFWKRRKAIFLRKVRRKLSGEWISDFNFTYDMPQLILFLVTSIFRLALK